jgi:CRP-like cAMP-binding protein
MHSENRKITEQLFKRPFPAAGLFGDLPAGAEKSLLAVKQTFRCAEDEIIFRSGQLPRFVYILRAGKAVLIKGGELYPVSADELLGLPEAISNLPYKFDLQTLAPSEFEIISREDFLLFLQTQPATCFRLLEMFGANLQKIYQFLR